LCTAQPAQPIATTLNDRPIWTKVRGLLFGHPAEYNVHVYRQQWA